MIPALAHQEPLVRQVTSYRHQCVRCRYQWTSELETPKLCASCRQPWTIPNKWKAKSKDVNAPYPSQTYQARRNSRIDNNTYHITRKERTTMQALLSKDQARREMAIIEMFADRPLKQYAIFDRGQQERYPDYISDREQRSA